MKCFIYLLFICAFNACGILGTEKLETIPLKDFYARNAGTRIINGTQATTGQFPWQVFVVGVLSSGMQMACGGSIIDNTTVLTAAHCAVGPVWFQLLLGRVSRIVAEPGSIVVNATKAYIHPNYNNQTLENDVAIIKLNTPIHFTSTIQPIRLPSPGETVGAPIAVRVSGWGRTSDNDPNISTVLNWVDLTTISNTVCAAIFRDVFNSTLCAVGNPNHSTCNGDSGGPLIVLGANNTPTQVGIVSFVSVQGCGVGHPSGYVRTESVLNFISNYSGGNGIFGSKNLFAVIIFIKILSL